MADQVGEVALLPPITREFYLQETALLGRGIMEGWPFSILLEVVAVVLELQAATEQMGKEALAVLG
jgi:hypothetical protein